MPIARSVSRSALMINGTVGAGKTSVGEMVGDLLIEAGVPNAVIDVNWLRRSWPSPADDCFNVAMALRNLRSVARNYLDAGAVRIVLAGVIETKAGRDRHQDALGVPSRCADPVRGSGHHLGSGRNRGFHGLCHRLEYRVNGQDGVLCSPLAMTLPVSVLGWYA